MSILAGLANDKAVVVEADNDRVGGFSTLASNVYGFKVQQAFVTQALTKAMALNVHFINHKGETLRQQFYMTSGEAKGCKNYYEKDGKKFYLPGYNQANSLCLLILGKEIHELDTEKKSINLYDFEEKKEVPTEIDSISELIGEDIIAGVIKIIEDKKKKDPGTGKYESTGETREVNEVDKFFRAEDRLTAQEIKANRVKIENGEEVVAEFFDKWVEANKDKVRDKSSKDGAKPGAPGAKRATGSAATKSNMFV